MNLLDELSELEVAFDHVKTHGLRIDTLCLPSLARSDDEHYLLRGKVTEALPHVRKDVFGFMHGDYEVTMLFHPSLKKKYLLILPCNAGALHGNYFEGNFWAMAERMLVAAGLRDKVDICAIDSIKTFLAPDKLGPLVHEREMWRVYGYDFHPNEHVNPASPANWERLGILADELKLAMGRIFPHYIHIYALVPVRGYRVAFTAAVHELGLNNVYIEDQPSACFRRKDSMSRLIAFLNRSYCPGGIYHVFPHAGEYSPEWKTQMVYGWRENAALPGRFCYWRWPEYHDSGV